MKFSEINTRGKADAVILLQPDRLLRGHVDEADPALSGHSVQNFPGIAVVAGIVTDRRFHSVPFSRRVQPKSLW